MSDLKTITRRSKIRGLSAAVIALILVASSCSSSDSSDDSAKVPPTAKGDPPYQPGELPAAPVGKSLTGATPCPPETGVKDRVGSFTEAPPMCITPGQPLVADIKTNAGTIVVDLAVNDSPKTVNNFVVLARYGFYDGIPFHRLAPDFVIQVGGSGEPGFDGQPDYSTTGPGYDGTDAEYPKAGYKIGDVAMARAQNVSGSQFFVATSEAASGPLDSYGNYPLLGHVSVGLDLAQAMSAKGDPDGVPQELFTIEKITIHSP